jgi:hypothetical protein
VYVSSVFTTGAAAGLLQAFGGKVWASVAVSLEMFHIILKLESDSEETPHKAQI